MSEKSDQRKIPNMDISQKMKVGLSEFPGGRGVGYGITKETTLHHTSANHHDHKSSKKSSHGILKKGKNEVTSELSTDCTVEHPSNMKDLFKEGQAPNRLSHHKWWKFVNRAWSGPDTVVIHIVLLPRGMSLTDAHLKDGKVISEKRYKLEPGVIPSVSLFPAERFKVYCDPSIVPDGFSTERFDVEGREKQAEKAAILREDSVLLHDILDSLPKPFYEASEADSSKE